MYVYHKQVAKCLTSKYICVRRRFFNEIKKKVAIIFNAALFSLSLEQYILLTKLKD